MREKKLFLLMGALQTVKALVGNGLSPKQDFGSDVYEAFVLDGFVSLQSGDAEFDEIRVGYFDRDGVLMRCW